MDIKEIIANIAHFIAITTGGMFCLTGICLLIMFVLTLMYAIFLGTADALQHIFEVIF